MVPAARMAAWGTQGSGTMLEFLDAYQSLEYTLALRDRLEGATDPLEVPALIAEAIRAIVGCDGERARHLSLRLSDRLEDILAQVTATYKTHVIPRDYREWWAPAREELRDLIGRCTREIQTLHALPCASRRQRRNVREQRFYVSLSDADLPYQTTIDDPVAFARWKTAMEQALRDRIEGFLRTEQRLRDNLPDS
jgi:hypothetical protein